MLVVLVLTVFILTEMIGKALKVSLLLIILIIHYYDGFKQFNNKIDDIVYGVFFFILFWMVWMIFVEKLTQTFIDRFKEYEKVSCDIRQQKELKQIYEDQYYSNNQKIDKDLKEKINYQFMKQGFINPIELPCVTESFLRSDFNLAMYFELCLKRMLKDFFTFGVQACVIVFIMVICWELIGMLGTMTESILLVSFPFISGVCLYLQKRHFDKIRSYLVPQVDTPEHINFQIDLDVRDPFDYYETMQFPPYMEPNQKTNDDDSEVVSAQDDDISSLRSRKKNKSKDHHSDGKSLSGQSNKDEGLNDSVLMEEKEHKRISRAEMFQSPETFLATHQNKHERLFILGKFGVVLQKVLLLTFFIQMVLWMAQLVDYKYFLGEESKNYSISSIYLVDYFITMVSL